MFNPIVGISFGNVSSSIAIVKQDNKGTVEVIANQDGERTIPSALSYKGDDEYHGGQAIQQLVRNPKNTIINFRDFLSFNKFSEIDSQLIKDRTGSGNGCELVDIGDDKPGFILEQGKTKLSVIEVSARHLKNLKLAAEDYTGITLEKCTLTVPVDFNEAAKKNMAQAALKAGLQVVQFIAEPTAGLLSILESSQATSHSILVNKREQKDKNVVVADFGGFTSTVSVYSIRNNGILSSLHTEINHKLGGENMDDALIKFLAADFEKKTKTKCLNNIRSLAKLKINAILTKKTLSNVTNATVGIDSLADGLDLHTSINRLRYELVISKIVNEMASFVESTIAKTGLDILEIDAVVLLGGASFTPKLTVNLQDLFSDGECEIISLTSGNESQHPDEMISAGAAYQAALLEEDDTEALETLVEHAVSVPHLNQTIGLVNAEGAFEPIFEKNTPLPSRKSFKLYKQQKDFQLELYTGKVEIKETVEEPPAKEEKIEQDNKDDDESDWSDDEDDEPEVIREKVYAKQDKLLSFGGKGGKKGCELIFEISKDCGLKIVVRDLSNGEVTSKAQL
mgnify:FL=1